MHSRLARLGRSLALIATVVALAAPAVAADIFDRNTMLGWQRSTGASVMAYARLPFHATKADTTTPRLGVAMTAPVRSTGGRVMLHAQAPRLVDIGFNAKGFNAKGFDGAWSASINVGATPAWSYDPERRSGEQHRYLFDSGLSWVGVGLITVGLFAGTLFIAENG